jgi:hypothetical protein
MQIVQLLFGQLLTDLGIKIEVMGRVVVIPGIDVRD